MTLDRKARRRSRVTSFLFCLHLLLFSSLPADEAVQIVEEEGEEARKYGKIADVGKGGNPPQNEQNDIVAGIGDREIGVSLNGLGPIRF